MRPKLDILSKGIFGYILSSCSYLTAFDTVYVMVDTCNHTAHGAAQDSGKAKRCQKRTPCTGSRCTCETQELSTHSRKLMRAPLDKGFSLWLNRSLSWMLASLLFFGSFHAPLLHWDDWTRRCGCLPDGQFDEMVSIRRQRVVFHPDGRIFDENPWVDKQHWIQSRLALSPLIATCT